MDMYMREAELIVDSRRFHTDDYTIFFDVPFDDDSEAQVAEIEIYNLSDSTLNNIKKGQSVILNAGYDGDVGAILVGVLQRKKTVWEGADKLTTLKCTDAGDEWRTQTISKAYKPGIKASQIIRDLSDQLGIEVGAISLPEDKTFYSGRTISGRIVQTMARIANDCGAQAHVTRGKVFIRDPRHDAETSFDITPDRGLIGTPERFEENDESGEEDSTIEGWTVNSLLNHRIMEDVHVRVESSTANGVYRVWKGRHRSNDNEFVTEIEVV